MVVLRQLKAVPRGLLLLLAVVASGPALADQSHPLLDSRYWLNVGAYFAARDFDASAGVSVIGQPRPLADFESSLDLNDAPEIFMAEFGWQFNEKWGLGLQVFESKRNARKTLERSIEWKDLIFDVGVDISAGSEFSVTRIVLARHFRDRGPHKFRFSAGLHWLDIGAFIAGEATLNDLSTEFRRSAVSARAPLPNLGGVYQFSPNERWLLSVRADWLSASVDEISGGLWNVAASANLNVTDHFGAGLSYQFFDLDGSTRSDSWRGKINSRFSGPYLFLSAYW